MFKFGTGFDLLPGLARALEARIRACNPPASAMKGPQEILELVAHMIDVEKGLAGIIPLAVIDCRDCTVIALFVALLIPLAEPLSAGPGDRISLVSLADWDHVTVTLDLSRFAAERAGIIRIVNISAFTIQGRIPACSTVFLPADAGLSRLRPAESGNFVVGAKRTVSVSRLFRVVDAGKRAPAAGATYTLADLLDPSPTARTERGFAGRGRDAGPPIVRRDAVRLR